MKKVYKILIFRVVKVAGIQILNRENGSNFSYIQHCAVFKITIPDTLATPIVKMMMSLCSVRGLERSELGGFHGCPIHSAPSLGQSRILRRDKSKVSHRGFGSGQPPTMYDTKNGYLIRLEIP